MSARWTRQENIRTLALLAIWLEVRDPLVPVYQQIAAEAGVMRARGLRVAAIARHFRVDHHTVDKAVAWFRRS